MSKKDDKKADKNADKNAESKSTKKGAPSVSSHPKISPSRGPAGVPSPPRDDVIVHDVNDAALSIELSSQALSADNRKGDRTPAVHTVDVRGVFAGAVLAADGPPRTRDVSAGGVFVETAHLLEVGDPVLLSFPQEDGKRLVVNGRVRWVTPFGRLEDPVPGMGIEFVGLDQHKLERLESVLRSARG